MWKVINGQAIGRRDTGQITLFDSVGFAIEDFSALRYIRSKLTGTGLYQDLDMIADPDDPRDLFGMLQQSEKE
jgi:ornithine cyclodeaminase